VPAPFYKIFLEGGPPDGHPIMLWEPLSWIEVKVGSRIPVASFEPTRGLNVGEIIASIDGFNKLETADRRAMIEALGRHRPRFQEGEIVRIESDSDPSCLGRLVVREVASRSGSS
jgi:hypothetical protein